MTGPLLEAALSYVRRTIPLHPRPKAPAVGNGWLSWGTTPGAIGRHWDQHPDANVGIRTDGGLAVLDIDPCQPGPYRRRIEHQRSASSNPPLSNSGGHASSKTASQPMPSA